MAAQRVLITGGNSGIGLELARQLLGLGHEVLLACRDMQRGQAAAEALQKSTKPPPQQQQQQVDVVHCDLADLSSVRRCAAQVQQRWDRLDLLVLNAAVITAAQQTTVDGLDAMFQVNHAAHALVARLLLPLLAKSSNGRIVVVSSELHQRVAAPLDQPDALFPAPPAPAPWQPMAVYSHTKLQNVWFTRHLAKQLPANVTVNAVSPGFAPTTGLGRHVQGALGRLVMQYVLPWLPMTVTVQEGARRVRQVAELPQQPRVSGEYFSRGAQAPCSAAAADDARAARAWELTEQALARQPAHQ